MSGTASTKATAKTTLQATVKAEPVSKIKYIW